MRVGNGASGRWVGAQDVGSGRSDEHAARGAAVRHARVEVHPHVWRHGNGIAEAIDNR